MKSADLIKRETQRDQQKEILVRSVFDQEIFRRNKVFIVGPPRSGTTLLYRLISGDNFLPECSIISSMLKIFHEYLLFSDDGRFEYFAANKTNLASIFRTPILDVIRTAYSKNTNLPDTLYFKDPILTLYIEYLDILFDDKYKVIYSVRDPRAVVNSMSKVLKAQHPDADTDQLVDEAIILSFQYFEKINFILERSREDGRFLIIRYEQIARKDKEEFRRLEEFLHTPISRENIQRGTDWVLDKSSPHFSDTFLEPITSREIFKYRSELTREQIGKINHYFSYYIAQFSY